MLRCIRCGACMNICPVYRHISGHGYGSVYPGPMGAVLTPLFKGYDVAGDLPYASTLCGACTENCPVAIPLHELLMEHRHIMADIEKLVRKQKKQSSLQRLRCLVTPHYSTLVQKLVLSA